MKKISLISIAFLMTVSVSAQTNRDKIVAEVLRLEADYIESSKKPSAADFDRFYTPDFVVTAQNTAAGAQ